MIGGHRALRLLAWLKLKGVFRRQARRMRSVSGLVFMLLGLLLMGAWLVSLAFAPRVGGASAWEPELLRRAAQLGLAVFSLLSLSSALSVKGVWFHRPEVERLFSSPISRADLVRHRMQVDAGRTLLGALVLGYVTSRRMPVPVYGFCGGFAALLAIGVLRQTASLVLADARGRIGRFFQRHSLSGLRVLIGLFAWVAVMLLIFGESLVPAFRGATGGSARELFERVVMNEPARWLLAPFRPWAEMMTARALAPFLLWSAVALALTFTLYELTARLPIDFREQSLATSEEIARRLRSFRRGGPFAGGPVSGAAAGRRVPWLFGRGPFGAVAWIKTAEILRKARGTLLTALFVIALVTFVLTFPLSELGDRGTEASATVGSALIGLVGMWYLGGALRFDFRADLERMEAIKSWPLAPARLFLAQVLPAALLISLLLAAAILARALFLGVLTAGVFLTLSALPFATLAWLAVDNAVFLFAPVRFVPGQEGTLHHTGRALVLLFLRGGIFLVGAGAVGLAAYGVLLAGGELLGLDRRGAALLAGAAGFAVLLAIDAALVLLGGRMLRRFDVARDRA